jgi:hypothetical protein
LVYRGYAHFITKTPRQKMATPRNEGFGAMAALPRVDRICYFRTLLDRVGNVLEAATAPSRKTLGVNGRLRSG